jgi:hypothetical protein
VPPAIVWMIFGKETRTAVAITTALQGAGDYGKRTLANKLCRDPEVRCEFTDGILGSRSARSGTI